MEQKGGPKYQASAASMASLEFGVRELHPTRSIWQMVGLGIAVVLGSFVAILWLSDWTRNDKCFIVVGFFILAYVMMNGSKTQRDKSQTQNHTLAHQSGRDEHVPGAAPNLLADATDGSVTFQSINVFLTLILPVMLVIMSWVYLESLKMWQEKLLLVVLYLFQAVVMSFAARLIRDESVCRKIASLNCFEIKSE